MAKAKATKTTKRKVKIKYVKKCSRCGKWVKK